MKKLLSVMAILLLLVGAGVYFLSSNLDGLVRRAIETAGTQALGTSVRVQSVSINLAAGSATLSGFSIHNPQGFSNQDMMRFDELQLALDISSLRSDVIRINSIRSVNPFVLYEVQDGRTNLNAVLDRLPAREPSAEGAGPDPVLAIDEMVINGIQGSVQADILPRPLTVNLGNFTIPPVQGTPPELARQIARPLLTQLARNAAGALQSAAAAVVEQELRDRADQGLQEVEERARDAVEGLWDRLRWQRWELRGM